MNVKRWQSVPLGSIAEFRNGLNYNKDNFGKGLKVVNVKDFQDKLVAQFDGLDEINPEGIVKEECLLKDGDIIFVRSNGNRELIGRSMLVKGISEPISHSAFSIKVRLNFKDALPRFFAYVFRTDLIRTELSNRGGGTNISNLNQDILGSLKVPIPPLPTQRKIAGILSAYDDLIENNTRRIAILEQMAQAIYREWFVEFRFPGHDGVKLVDSTLGKIPKGWELGRLDDLLVLQRGFDITRAEQSEGTYPVISSSGPKSSHREFKVKGPGVVIGRKGTLGTVFYVEEDHWPHDTTLWIKEYRRSTPLFSFFLLRSLNLAQYDSGASNPTLNRNHVHSLPMVLPPSKVIEQFEKMASPMFKQQRIHERRTTLLRTTRDLLLPKLISGELNVDDLDLETGEPEVEAEA